MFFCFVLFSHRYITKALMVQAHFLLQYNCDVMKVMSVFVNFIINSVFFDNFLSKVPSSISELLKI